MPFDDDSDRGRHAGQEHTFFVVHSDDDTVRHHVVLGARLQSHLLDSSLEVSVGVGLDTEVDVLAFNDLADVALVHGGQDFHLRQVLRQYEQDGCGEAGRDRLTDLDVAGDHDASDWGADLGVFEVSLSALQIDLRVSVVDLGQCQLVPLDLHFLLRDDFHRMELLRPVGFPPRLIELCSPPCQSHLRGEDGLGENGRVDGGQEVARFDPVVVVDIDLGDEPGHLSSDLHGLRGL